MDTVEIARLADIAGLIDRADGQRRHGAYDFSLDGAVDRVSEVPVLEVTGVVFGGPELDILSVTWMARPPLPRFAEAGPMAGHLFAIHGRGVRGMPEPRFGG